jgi:hypothetical protein
MKPADLRRPEGAAFCFGLFALGFGFWFFVLLLLALFL